VDKEEEWRLVAEEQGKIFVDLGSDGEEAVDAPLAWHRTLMSIREPNSCSRLPWR
jgi:hypothetical protein